MSAEPYAMERLNRPISDAPPPEPPRDITGAVWSDRWSRGLARLRAMAPAPEPPPVPVTPTKTEHIINLVADLRRRQLEVLTIEETLKAKQAEIRGMEEMEIPDAMDDADLEKMTLPDGSKLTAPVEFIPQYLVENGSKVFLWLRDNGFADRLKRTVTVEFGMGEDALAGKFVNFLAKNLPDRWKDRVYIHQGTEKVIGREVTERGLPLPADLTIFPLRRIKIVRPRGSKRTSEDEQDGS